MTDAPDSDLWVFGYGSLMWNPGFDHAERCLARLRDYARSFCMRSVHHRGTEADPGLVLALDIHSGAACEGVAFRVPAAGADAVRTYLRERELISSAYVEATLPLRLVDGREVQALTFIVDRDHVQYCGGLPLEEQAAIIAHAHGGRGPNDEYLFNTADHLSDLGIADEELTWLSRRVRAIATRGPAPDPVSGAGPGATTGPGGGPGTRPGKGTGRDTGQGTGQGRGEGGDDVTGRVTGTITGADAGAVTGADADTNRSG